MVRGIQSRRARRPVSLMAALFALFCQLAFGAVVMPADPAPAEVALADIAATICHAAAPGHDQPAPHHADYAYCPICAGVALPAPLLTPAPFLPPPTLVLLSRPDRLPNARAPPARRFAAFIARAPPAPVDV